MSYSKEVFNLARVFLENIRNNNISEYEKRRKQFCLKSSEGAKIEGKIARSAAAVARAVISGK